MSANPDLLYKFVKNIDSAQSLLRGDVKFARIDELNDPSEMVPRVAREQVLKSLDQLRRAGYSNEDLKDLRRQERLLVKLAPDRFRKGQVPATEEEATRQIHERWHDDFENSRAWIERIVTTLAERVGMFCLGKTCVSLPLWAHYADMAKGFAIGFRDLPEVFSGDDTGILNALVDVNYTKDQTGVTYDPRSHASIFFSKFPDWGYEREVRVVLPLSECRQVNTGTGIINCRKIPEKHVAQIILGWNMPAPDRQQIIELARDVNPQVKICAAEIVQGEVVVRETG